MKLTLRNGRYVFFCTIAERFPAREAGFLFNHQDAPGVWSTDSARRALQLASYADDELRASILKAAQSEPDPERITLSFDGSIYRFHSPFKFKELAKQAGMQYAKHPRPHWWTADSECAIRVFNNSSQYEGLFECSAELRAQLEGHLEQRNASLEASRALDAEINIPAPNGCEYLPFQKAGVKFAVTHPKCLIADDMGLGKTWQALGTLRFTDSFPAVVVCPASLKINWAREVSRLLPDVTSILLFSKPSFQFTDSMLRLFALNTHVGQNTFQKSQDINDILNVPFIANLSKFMSIFRAVPLTRSDSTAHSSQPIHKRLVGVADPHAAMSTRSPRDIAFPVNEPGKIGAINGARGKDDRRNLLESPNSSNPSTVPKVSLEGRIINAALGGDVSNRFVADSDPIHSDLQRLSSEFVKPVERTNSAFSHVDTNTGGRNPKLSTHIPHYLASENAFDRNLDLLITNLSIHRFRLLFIINYDVLTDWLPFIRGLNALAIIGDEIQKCKNLKTKRAKAFWSLSKTVERVVLLSGTPLENRVIEFWPIAHHLAPEKFSNYWHFAKRYCGGHRGPYGFDVSGATNLAELQTAARSTFMIRRRKSEVLREIPPKRRQVIELPSAGLRRLVESEQDALARHEAMLEELRLRAEMSKASDDPEEHAQAVDELREGRRVVFAEMSRCRHETALGKLPLVVEHVTDVLEEVPKVLIFAHHVDVIKELASIFKCGFIYGEVPSAQRLDIVGKFNENAKEKVLVCQSETGGVGFSVKASHVVFAELEWVPGTMTQCEDRCHGIGRGIEGEPLLVQHLVLEGSLDAQMARTLIAKQEIADRALDREGGIDIELDDVDTEFAPEDLILPEKLASTDESMLASRPATFGVKRDQIAREAEKLSDEHIQLIHTGLKTLAGMCDGAFARDGSGFNAMDTRIGKSLAARAMLSAKAAVLGRQVLKKYHRQIPKELYDAIF